MGGVGRVEAGQLRRVVGQVGVCVGSGEGEGLGGGVGGGVGGGGGSGLVAACAGDGHGVRVEGGREAVVGEGGGWGGEGVRHDDRWDSAARRSRSGAPPTAALRRCWGGSSRGGRVLA